MENIALKTPQEKQLQKWLRIYTFLFAGAVVAYESLPLLDITTDFGRQVLFVPNSVVKVGILSLICMYTAGNVRVRIGLMPIFFSAHFVSVTAMGLFFLFSDTSTSIAFGTKLIPVSQALISAMALDVVVNIPLIILYVRARKSVGPKERADAVPADLRTDGAGTENTEEVNRAVRALKIYLFVAMLMFIVGGIVYELGTMTGEHENFFIQLPLISNSVVKVALLAMCAYYITRRVRENLPVAGILVSASLLSIAAKCILLCTGEADVSVPYGQETVSISRLIWLSILVEDVLFVGILMFLTLRVWKKLYQPKFLRPIEYRALIALADVIVFGKDEKVPFLKVAKNADTYIMNIKARRTWVYRVSLFAIQFLPILQLRPPLTEIDSEDRKRFLEANFYHHKFPSWVPKLIGNYLRAPIRIVQQMAYLGYYSDPACHESIHYTPFSQRGKPIPPPHHIDLKVLLPKDVTTPTLEADVCIVGSGAAGSTLAYELAKQGRSILIVEKGEYVQPKDFNENEVEMIGKLYADGVYQQTEDFKFTIIQGNCVGGSTVVNNAVSFSLPKSVLAKWNDPNEYDSRLVGEDLDKSEKAMRDFLSIQPQSQLSSLNPSYQEVDAGMSKYDPGGQRLEYKVVNANVNPKGCVGCGYCNIGCKFGMKLSMLDHTLPIAQKKFPDRVRILAECTVDRVSTMTGKVKRAHSLDATLRGGRHIMIKANTIVLSAGTIASSYILKSSGLGRYLPVGKGICFNMGTPIYAKFKRSIRATEGLQISHYLKPTTDKGYVFETWWNPPVSQAINMPGWFGDHFVNMTQYDKIMAVGILVGTRSEGTLVNAATGGAGVIFKPGKEDRQKMGAAIKEMGEILFKAGAEKVMLNTWSYHSFDNLEELIRVVDDLVQKPDELALGSGHPQGGNAISNNPELGVVDENFRVHGYSNLYVCDASVFPTSLTVNPQLTVMTLAHYASSRIK